MVHVVVPQVHVVQVRTPVCTAVKVKGMQIIVHNIHTCVPEKSGLPYLLLTYQDNPHATTTHTSPL
jgi:hypothetical protein